MLGAWRAYMDAWERDACVRVGRSRGWRAAWETDAVRAREGGERDAGGKMCVCVCFVCVCFVCALCVCVCALCVCFVCVRALCVRFVCALCVRFVCAFCACVDLCVLPVCVRKKWCVG